MFDRTKERVEKWIADKKYKYRIKLLCLLKVSKADWAVRTPFVKNENMFVHIRHGYDGHGTELGFGKIGANVFCSYYHSGIYEGQEIYDEFLPILEKIEPKEIRIVIDKKYQTREVNEVIRQIRYTVQNFDGTVLIEQKSNIDF